MNVIFQEYPGEVIAKDGSRDINGGMKTFAEKARAAMKARGINVSGLAERVGVKQPQMSRWLDLAPGKPLPKLDALISIARALGVTVDHLVRDDADRETGDGLTDDERFLLRVFRSSPYTADEVIAMMTGASASAAPRTGLIGQPAGEQPDGPRDHHARTG